MKIQRRDVLSLAGGAAAGLAVSPLPWRLLGDTAIWSQNWHWMPRVPRGAVEVREARCTLCPAACAVKLRMTEGVVHGVWPNGSAMCPAGFAAHHLAWHPLRLRECRRKGKAVSVEEALSSLRAAVEQRCGAVAVLDLAPGRASSLLHRRHLAAIGGAYLTPPAIEGGTAQAVAALLEKRTELAADLAHVRAVLSVGTPVLDGWAAPSSAVERSFRLVQAEARRSRTAGLADEWLPVKPGAETALLLAIGHCWLARPEIRSQLARLKGAEPWQRAAEAMPPQRAAELAGIEASRIEATAALLLDQRPALVLADGDPIGGPLSRETRAAAATLNALLGAEGFRPRPALPMPKAWTLAEAQSIEDAAEGSIGVLIIDEPWPGVSVPWQMVERKLSRDAVVAAVTWNRAQFARHAEWLLPAPVWLEAPLDAAQPNDAPRAQIAIAPAVMPAPEGVMAAAEVTARLAGMETALSDELAELAGAAGGAGAKLAEEGFYWASEAGNGAALKVSRAAAEGWTAEDWLRAVEPAAASPALVAFGWRQAAVSPVLGKLWQESELREGPQQAAAHPDLLRRYQMEEGALARLMSPRGVWPVRVRAARARPDVIAVCGGPALALACEVRPDGTWSLGETKVVKS
ncbi:MAG: hypothetical protein ACP5VC_16740 [Bryobacteraceae bacterium]